MRSGSRSKADRMPAAVIKAQKMRWFKRLIAAAVLSMSTVLAGVGASKALDAILAELCDADDSAKTDIHAVAEQLSPSVGLPVPVLEGALKRQAYGIKPIDAQVIAEQQKLAGTFLALGLIPKSITVSELARKSGT